VTRSRLVRAGESSSLIQCHHSTSPDGHDPLASSLPITQTTSPSTAGTPNLTISGANLYRVFFCRCFERSREFEQFCHCEWPGQGGTAATANSAVRRHAPGRIVYQCRPGGRLRCDFSGHSAVAATAASVNLGYNGGRAAGGGLGGDGGHGHH